MNTGDSGGMPRSIRPRVNLGMLRWIVLWAAIASALAVYSYRLMALPDRTFIDRTCTLFHTDVREAALTMRAASAPDVKHPLARELWWPFGYVVRHTLEPFTSTRLSSAIAACIAMALFGSLGVVACALAARAIGVPFSKVGAALPVAVLSTANAVVLVPEFYGISYGVLSITFLASVALRGRTRLVVLTALTALLAATTVTNGVFGALCLLMPEGAADWRRTAAMRAVRVAIVSLFVALGAGALTGVISGYGATQVPVQPQEGASESLLRSVRLGRIETIGQLATYSGLAWVYPIVGPTPHIAGVHPFPTLLRRETSPPPGRVHLSYDPWKIQDYRLISGMSALVWAAALLWCLTILFRPGDQQRAPILLLATWIGGNILVHLVWGDEMFMYSPHWSWALSAIFLLGSKWIPARALAGVTIAVAVGQAATVADITAAASQIANLCQ